MEVLLFLILLIPIAIIGGAIWMVSRSSQHVGQGSERSGSSSGTHTSPHHDSSSDSSVPEHFDTGSTGDSGSSSGDSGGGGGGSSE